MKKKPAAMTEQEKLKYAKAVYKAAPFATKVYLILKTRLGADFIQKHWGEIANQ